MEVVGKLSRKKLEKLFEENTIEVGKMMKTTKKMIKIAEKNTYRKTRMKIKE